MARFGLFGDSYIKRLQNFCDGDLHVPGSTRFVHRGGLRCDGIDEMMEKKLTAAAEKTDIVFLSIGGNDISPISKPEKIYDDIKSLIEKLKEAGVRRVFISEILPRADFKKSVPSGLTKSKFDRDRKKINLLLSETYGTDVIKFKDIRLPRDYHHDLVHLAYPSLNLTLHVSKDQQSVQCVLPGLRYDDIDHTGQPNMATVFDIMSHVETAAVGKPPDSFIDYLTLRQHGLRHYIKACVMEVNSNFYEMTTPKAPLDIRLRLCSIGNASFTTLSELSCGGKMSPSITIENVHCLIHKPTARIHELPEWWKDKFSPILKNPTPKLEVTPATKPDRTFKTSILVPLSDTDHNERTRCASYLRYFMDNSSVGSQKSFYEHIKSSFHEFHIKRLSMYYYQASHWGDTLTAETWQRDKPREFHCLINNNSAPVWYGKMELHESVFGLPSLETNGSANT